MWRQTEVSCPELKCLSASRSINRHNQILSSLICVNLFVTTAFMHLPINITVFQTQLQIVFSWLQWFLLKKDFGSLNNVFRCIPKTKIPWFGFLDTVQLLNRFFFLSLPAFIYVDALIDHAHKEMMSQGFSVSRWAGTLIRKSIVLSIGLAVFEKG